MLDEGITMLAASPPASVNAGPEPERPRQGEKLIAVTVRLDRGRYEKLKLLGVKRRQSNQQILVRALDMLLAQK